MKRFDMPDDFPARASASLTELAAIYRISKSTARKWRAQVGVRIPPGAPKGNRNAMPRKKGADDLPAIRTCLSCTEKRCRGWCAKVH